MIKIVYNGELHLSSSCLENYSKTGQKCRLSDLETNILINLFWHDRDGDGYLANAGGYELMANVDGHENASLFQVTCYGHDGGDHPHANEYDYELQDHARVNVHAAPETG